MLKGYVLSAVLMATSSVCCFGQTQSNVLKIDYTVTSTFTRAGTTSAATTLTATRYVMPDGTTRTETTDNQRHKKTVVISSEAEDYQITFDDQSHMATRLNGVFHAAHSGKLGMAGTKLPLGKSNIFGYACQGYENDFADGTTLKHWVCTDPKTGATFNGRTEAVRGGSRTEETITNLTPGVTVPVSLFQVPQGYALAVTDAANGIASFTPTK